MPKNNLLFLQTLEDLRRQLLASFSGGDRIPSQRALARMYGVSQATIQRAVRRLAQEGWVRTHKGSGVVLSMKRPSGKGRRAPSKNRVPIKLGLITERLDWEYASTYADPTLPKALMAEAQKRGAEIVWVTSPHRSRNVPSRNVLDPDRIPWNEFDIGLLLEVNDAHSLLHPTLAKHKILAIDQDATLFGLPSVAFDDFGAGCLAARHLYDRGHRRFAVIHPVSDPGYATDPAHTARRHGFEVMVERLRGCILQEWRLEVPYRTHFLKPLVKPPSWNRIRAFANLPAEGRPTAMFAPYSQCLPEMGELLARSGLYLSRELSLVSVSWDESLSIALPLFKKRRGGIKKTAKSVPMKITCVHLDLPALARRVLETAEAMAAGESFRSDYGSHGSSARLVTAPMVLKPGESSGPAII